MQLSTTLIFLVLCSVPCLKVPLVGAGGELHARKNPFTPEAYLDRYWRNQISNNLPTPGCLFDKASPLGSAQYAAFSKLAADQNLLPAQFLDLCFRANLLCLRDLSSSLEKHSPNGNFQKYQNKNFTNYGTDIRGGADVFKTYSDGDNVVADSFHHYSRDSIRHDDKFTAYAKDGNVVDQSFNTYGASSTGGGGEFSTYVDTVNVPNLKFTSYSQEANGRRQSFKTYSADANSGDQVFTSYGKNGNGAGNSFTGYGNNSNVIGSTFNNYGENVNAANDTFTSYGANTNGPKNNFRNYGTHGKDATETFTNYRDQANVGDDNFESYAKNSTAAKASFVNYGNSFNEGTDKFSGYGKVSTSTAVGFKIYSTNNTFTDYNKNGTTTFATYKNTTAVDSGIKVNNKWIVEPGKFFREALLKTGTVMPMPDIRDKMPNRSFLPRVIVSKLPFSTSKITEIKKIFHAGGDDSSMSKMLIDAVTECERAPSSGETKRCVASIEDMIDFATSILGRNVTVRSTENNRGYNSNITLGEVKGINGGKITESVSCHQSLYPYMLYYCHSVPKVRVYEADILDLKSNIKINSGVAICHLDTSSWSPTHGAFIALGSKPGKIEVCHWIFENDMTWAIAD